MRPQILGYYSVDGRVVGKIPWKALNWPRLRRSGPLLTLPGMWTAWNKMVYFKHCNVNSRASLMIKASEDFNLLMINSFGFFLDTKPMGFILILLKGGSEKGPIIRPTKISFPKIFLSFPVWLYQILHFPDEHWCWAPHNPRKIHAQDLLWLGHRGVVRCLTKIEKFFQCLEPRDQRFRGHCYVNFDS